MLLVGFGVYFIVKEYNKSVAKGDLENYRQKLRADTAYPLLRKINLFNSVCIVLVAMILGMNHYIEYYVAYLVAGVILAFLNYSLTSIFFDIADSNLSVSKNTFKDKNK